MPGARHPLAARPPSARRLAAAIAIGLVAGVVLLASPVLGHAELVESTPADGDVLPGPPESVVAVFTEELDVDRSSIELRGPDGSVVAGGRVEPTDPLRMTILTPPLDPGTYEVRWTARSVVDDHVERGTFGFTVLAPTPTPAPTPAPTAPAPATPTPPLPPSPTAAPTPTPTPGPTEPTAADAVLPIGAALALVLVGAALLLRRR